LREAGVTHEAGEPTKAGVVGRRDVLSTIGFWIATVASAAILGIPSVRFAAGKSLEQVTEHWVPIGSPDKLTPGDFTSVVYSFRLKDAWREVKKEGLIYVRSAPRGGSSGEFLALSGVCTHLGCNVRWSTDASRFACPCHSGLYDADGAVISGPPPKPLRQLETRVTDGVLEAHI
jgi:Rieske Fe-S protein